jgi:thiol-disulfide isomerase/thioredoxin
MLRIVIAFFCAAPLWFCSPTLAQQKFQGTLDAELHAADFPFPVELTPASAELIKSIPESLAAGDKVSDSSMAFGFPDAVKFVAALVEKADGTSELYVDQNHDGHFTADEKRTFAPDPGEKQPGVETTTFNLPLSAGVYRTLPVRAMIRTTKSPSGSTSMLFVSPWADLDGSVELPGRTLLVRFVYNLVTGTVDPNRSAITMDVAGTGKLDMRSQCQTGDAEHPPIFHVGQLYLSVSAVDPGSHTFTVTSVPASAYTRFDLVKGATLPDFTYADFDKKQHRFSALSGKIRLIDFWATWCEPCVADFASKKQLYAKYHDRGLEILGIDGHEMTPDAGRKLIADKAIPWPQAAFDQDLVIRHFGVDSFPTFVLVDAQGTILSVTVGSSGELDGDPLDKLLATLLPN